MTQEVNLPPGRPRKIDSPEKMDRLVDEYVSSCQDVNNPKAITLTGMILALGLNSRESFDEYKTYDGFSDSVKRAKLIVECEYENRLVVGTNAAAPIFALKNFGWKDKQEVEVNDRRSAAVSLEDEAKINSNLDGVY